MSLLPGAINEAARTARVVHMFQLPPETKLPTQWLEACIAAALLPYSVRDPETTQGSDVSICMLKCVRFTCIRLAKSYNLTAGMAAILYWPRRKSTAFAQKRT